MDQIKFELNKAAEELKSELRLAKMDLLDLEDEHLPLNFRQKMLDVFDRGTEHVNKMQRWING